MTMKVIKRFNDGTALVQRPNMDPEIIKIEDIEEKKVTHKIVMTMLDGDGFVIEGTEHQIKITADANIHIKLTTEDKEEVSGVVFGDKLMAYLNLLKDVLASHIITPTSASSK